MKLEQPDLMNFEAPKNTGNIIKEMDVAQDPSARARELKKRSAQRPPEERVRTKRTSVKAPATIDSWQKRKDGGLGDLQ